MNRSIKTYSDLLQEEKRLQGQLESYKILLKEDITALKHQINPLYKIAQTAKKFFTRDNNGPLANFGLNFGVDFLIRRLLLARAGWIMKFVVPFVVKNYTSHFIKEEDKGKIIKAISKFIKKFTHKKKHEETVAPE